MTTGRHRSNFSVRKPPNQSEHGQVPMVKTDMEDEHETWLGPALQARRGWERMRDARCEMRTGELTTMGVTLVTR